MFVTQAFVKEVVTFIYVDDIKGSGARLHKLLSSPINAGGCALSRYLPTQWWTQKTSSECCFGFM